MKHNNKKSFILFLTISIIGILSIVLINYFQIKSFKIKNISEYKTYIQAQNHMSILKEITSEKKFEEKIEIQNSEFKIYAFKKDTYIHYFIEAKHSQIKLHESKKF